MNDPLVTTMACQYTKRSVLTYRVLLFASISAHLAELLDVVCSTQKVPRDRVLVDVDELDVAPLAHET